MKNIMTSIGIVIFVVCIMELIPLTMEKFRVLHKQALPYVLSDLKKCQSLNENMISTIGEPISPMRIDYISKSIQTVFFKYKISCWHYGYYVLVPRFSVMSDSIDVYFDKLTPSPIY